MSDRHGFGLAVVFTLPLAILAASSCTSSIDGGGLTRDDGGTRQDGGGGSGGNGGNGGNGGSGGAGGGGGTGGTADGGWASPDGDGMMSCLKAEIQASRPPVDVI